MRSFSVFFSKELTEHLRTKKLLVLLCIFLFFAIVAPVSARYMRDIIYLAAGDMIPADILPKVLPPSTWVDSWAQFYNNASQMCSICVILLFFGLVCGEKQSGSAALTLTKNLSHKSFILAKFFASFLVFITSFVAAVLVCFAYTVFLFGQAGALLDIMIGGFAYCIFIAALLSFTILASILARSQAISAVLGFLGLIILSLSGYIPGIGNLLPGAILSKAVPLTSGIVIPDLPWIIITCLGIISLTLLLSVSMLKRQEL